MGDQSCIYLSASQIHGPCLKECSRFTEVSFHSTSWQQDNTCEDDSFFLTEFWSSLALSIHHKCCSSSLSPSHRIAKTTRCHPAQVTLQRSWTATLEPGGGNLKGRPSCWLPIPSQLDSFPGPLQKAQKLLTQFPALCKDSASPLPSPGMLSSTSPCFHLCKPVLTPRTPQRAKFPT